jgi:hypothetical protein
VLEEQVGERTWFANVLNSAAPSTLVLPFSNSRSVRLESSGGIVSKWKRRRPGVRKSTEAPRLEICACKTSPAWAEQPPTHGPAILSEPLGVARSDRYGPPRPRAGG